DGNWYYFDPGWGAMLKGWQEISGNWYYLNPAGGEMLKGWQEIKDAWYYLNPASGEMLKGWQAIDGNWYYFAPGWGGMFTGWLTLDDQTYYLNPNGTMVKGWQYIEGKRKYFEFDTSGKQIKKYGWQTIGNKYVYYSFEDAGIYTNRWYFVDDKPYEFDVNGYWVENSFDNTTLGELEQALLNYFKENGITYKVGTLEYEEYLIAQLLEHKDAKLARHPKYTKILTYAAEYLHERTLNQPSDTAPREARSLAASNSNTFNMNHVADKTIKQIKEENDEKAKQDKVEEKMIQKSPETKEAQAVQKASLRSSYYYDPNAAVNYALTWALSRNSAYNDYSGGGGDCTNFVSQALYAGGMRPIIKDNLTIDSPMVTDGPYWFSKKVDMSLRYRVSASWMNVEKFYDFWSQRANMVTKTWSPMQVYYGSSPGDVIQYQYAGGGTKWHSLMVTGKNTSKKTIYISQHSGNRKNEDYSNIDKDANGDSQWIILKLTNN
ncbi:amidase domain-containing protein, partial [Bacillus toyonensis]